MYFYNRSPNFFSNRKFLEGCSKILQQSFVKEASFKQTRELLILRLNIMATTTITHLCIFVLLHCLTNITVFWVSS